MVLEKDPQTARLESWFWRQGREIAKAALQRRRLAKRRKESERPPNDSSHSLSPFRAFLGSCPGVIIALDLRAPIGCSSKVLPFSGEDLIFLDQVGSLPTSKTSTGLGRSAGMGKMRGWATQVVGRSSARGQAAAARWMMAAVRGSVVRGVAGMAADVDGGQGAGGSAGSKIPVTEIRPAKSENFLGAGARLEAT